MKCKCGGEMIEDVDMETEELIVRCLLGCRAVPVVSSRRALIDAARYSQAAC